MRGDKKKRKKKEVRAVSGVCEEKKSPPSLFSSALYIA
jgi:hypothetical protein